MKKNLRNLIVALVALLVLGGCLAGFLLWENSQKAKGDESGSSGTISLMSKGDDALRKVEVTNVFGTYSIQRESAEGEFALSTITDFPLSSIRMATLTGFGGEVTVTRLIDENASDLGQYGLGDPAAQVTFTYADGSTFSFAVGSSTPTGDYYLKPADSNAVYVVPASSGGLFLQNDQYFLDPTIIPSSTDGNIVTALTYTHGNDQFSLKRLEESVSDGHGNYYSYQFTSPSQRYVESSDFSTYFDVLSGLQASQIYRPHATAEEWAEAGLDSPVSTLTFTINEKEYTILVGSEKDGNFYIGLSGKDVIYLLSSTSLTWLDANYASLVQNVLFSPILTDLSRVTVEYDGSSYLFDLTHTTGDDGKTISTCSYNGKEIDIAKFTTYYKLVTDSRSEELLSAKPNGQTALKVTLTYTDASKPPSTVEYVNIDARNVAVVIDGQWEFSMRSTFIDQIKSETPKITQNQSVSKEW